MSYPQSSGSGGADWARLAASGCEGLFSGPIQEGSWLSHLLTSMTSALWACFLSGEMGPIIVLKPRVLMHEHGVNMVSAP